MAEEIEMQASSEYKDITKETIDSPIQTLDESISNYYEPFKYGENIPQLRPGIEVENKAKISQISGGIFSVPNNVQTQVTSLSTIIGDTSLSRTADRITIQSSGIYMVIASTRWQGAAGGLRNAHVAINGTVNFSDFGILNLANACTHYFYKIMSLSSGDYLTLELYQNSGGAVNTDYNNLGVTKLI